MAEYAEINQGVVQDSSARSSEDGEALKEIKMIKAWMNEAKHARYEFDKNWTERRKAYKGQTWKNIKNQGNKSQPEMNIVRMVIQTIIPILTDKRPGFNVIPKGPTSFAFSKMLSDGVENLWDRQSMQNKIVEVLMDCSIIDCGILKCSWDPDLEDGLGEVAIEVKDPEHIFINKGAEDFDRKCKYVIERVFKTVGELKVLFPEHAEEILPDSSKKKDDDYRGSTQDGTVTLVSPVDRDVGQGKGDNAPDATSSDNAMCEMWEVWYEDESVEEYEAGKNEDGSPKMAMRKKFPRGHLTSILPNQNVRLQSIENPYELPGYNPYTRFINTLMPRSFYGEGEIEPLFDIQKMINKLAQTITEYMRLMSNPVWIIDKESGVDPDKLTNKVGLVIRKAQNTEVKRDIAPPIERSIFEFFNLLQAFADQISGTHDITQGRKPMGVTAAEAIQTLQDAAQTRIRLKERNLETSLTKLGRIIISIMLQKYRAPRWVQVAGENPDIPNYMNFWIEEGDGQYKINQEHHLWDPNTQSYVAQSPVQAVSPKSIFDVKVLAGTSLPNQRAQRSNLALKLLEDGVIDGQEVLSTLEWPNAQEVTARMQQRADMAAQQQAMQPQPAAKPA